MSKFENIPTEANTELIFQLEIKLGDYEVLHQKVWWWNGNTAECFIFADEDIALLKDEEIEAVARTSALLNTDSSIIIKRSQPGFTFVSFNYESVEELTIENVEKARVLIMKNAVSLIQEAILLFNHGHYARAYTLSQIALKEVDKIPVLLQAVKNEANAEFEYNWRCFSHSKDSDCFPDYFKALKASEDAMTTTSDLNDVQKNSLYCGFEDGEPFSPIQTITREMAKKSILMNKGKIGWTRHSENGQLGKISEDISQMSFNGSVEKLFPEKLIPPA